MAAYMSVASITNSINSYIGREYCPYCDKVEMCGVSHPVIDFDGWTIRCEEYTHIEPDLDTYQADKEAEL